MITVIGTISYDKVIKKVYAHKLAGILDIFGKFIIIFAWGKSARGMIMTDSHNRCIFKNGLFDDYTYIDRCLSDAALRKTKPFQKLIVMI